MKKEFVWIKEVDRITIQSPVRNLADVYTHLKKQNSALCFKSKKNKVQSYIRMDVELKAFTILSNGTTYKKYVVYH